MAVLFIADNKMYRLQNGKVSEIKSGVLEGYTQRLYQNAKQNEWKTGGTGARFTETFDPYDAESKLAHIESYIDGLAPYRDGLLFSQTIDGISGLYIKREGTDDGIVFSDSSTHYTQFDAKEGRLAVSVAFGGESHIGIAEEGSTFCRTVTEGETLDSHPAWSKTEEKVLYYSSAGLELLSEQERQNESEDRSLPGMMNEMQNKANRNVGPSSVCRLDLSTYEISEVMTDCRYDFTKPATDSCGNLYFIKKPYRAARNKNVTVGGCLLDILLFPVRLVGAILGFLNFFSVVFSGKTIRKTGAAASRTRKASDVYIEGNLIRADKELKTNRKKGEKNPGIIPHSYELCRLSPDKRMTTLKKGVVAYCVSADGIYVSNGSGILFIDREGNETKLCDTPHVTYINYTDKEEMAN